MDIQLRETSQNDAEFLYRLHRVAMQAYVLQTWGQWDEVWQYRYFSENFDSSICQIIVVDKKDVGVISVLRRETDIFLRHIEVLPEYQRQGIGTQLILSLAVEASAKTLPLTLQVLKVNPAQELYERLGFLITSETDTHYLMTKTPQ
jgi:ribosomal protein S18 acetylase RimI-like enzyme